MTIEDQKQNNIPEFDVVIGYVLSMLFGLVFVDIISGFSSFVNALNKFPNKNFGYEISLLATFVYCVNIFRMLHGYIISLYDTKRNPTSFGAYPYSFRELVILVTTFIVPFISLSEILKIPSHPLSIFLLYQLPSVTYFFWDADLNEELQEMTEYGTNEAKQKAGVFAGFVKTWRLLDLCTLIFTICLVVFTIITTTDYYYLLLLLIAIFNGVVIFIDYIWKNNNFYFAK